MREPLPPSPKGKTFLLKVSKSRLRKKLLTYYCLWGPSPFTNYPFAALRFAGVEKAVDPSQCNAPCSSIKIAEYLGLLSPMWNFSLIWKKLTEENTADVYTVYIWFFRYIFIYSHNFCLKICSRNFFLNELTSFFDSRMICTNHQSI